jgi:hypothetical protein
MARARNIKPGFFANEELVELSFATRLLFIGLWTIADREGRLEDKPKRIKMVLFPADNLDVDASLNELQEHGFILRYTASEAEFIQILAFKKHQNPHKDEKQSTIPAPCLHHTNTVQVEDEHSSNPADSPIPYSPIPEETPPAPAKAVADDLPFPANVSSEIWQAFMDVRKGLKAKNTIPAVKALITQLNKLVDAGNNPEEVVLQSIRSSWKDLYEIKSNRQQYPPKQTVHEKRTATAQAMFGDLANGNDSGRIIDVSPDDFTEGHRQAIPSNG